jgi:hypothetical protein
MVTDTIARKVATRGMQVAVGVLIATAPFAVACGGNESPPTQTVTVIHEPGPPPQPPPPFPGGPQVDAPPPTTTMPLTTTITTEPPPSPTVVPTSRAELTPGPQPTEPDAHAIPRPGSDGA